MDGPRRSAAGPQGRKTIELAEHLHGRALSRLQNAIWRRKLKPKNIKWQYLRVERPFSSLHGFRLGFPGYVPACSLSMLF
jgi:hypothetical protein